MFLCITRERERSLSLSLSHTHSAWYSSGDLERAARHYREAARLDPGSHPARLNLGNTLGDLFRQVEEG